MFKIFVISLLNIALRKAGHTDDPRSLSIDMLRKFLARLTTVLVSIVGIGLGLLTILTDLIMSSYRQNELLVSRITGVGAMILIIAVGAIYYALKKEGWKEVSANVEHLPQRTPAISEAIAALIMEFVGRKRERRFLNASN